MGPLQKHLINSSVSKQRQQKSSLLLLFFFHILVLPSPKQEYIQRRLPLFPRHPHKVIITTKALCFHQWLLKARNNSSTANHKEITMLRRPATTLHITSEDVASYEDRRAREALVAAQQARRAAAVAAAQQSQADMEGVHQALQERERDDDVRRVREERIGVSRRR